MVESPWSPSSHGDESPHCSTMTTAVGVLGLGRGPDGPQQLRAEVVRDVQAPAVDALAAASAAPRPRSPAMSSMTSGVSLSAGMVSNPAQLT